MPAFGGMHPFPLRFGGGAHRCKAFTDALNSALGTAYDTEHGSNVYAQSMAIGRAINTIWATNERLGNQSDPDRLTDFLPRWERVFGVVASAGEPPARRRARLTAKFRAIAGPTDATLSETCSRLLGILFVGIEYTPLELAHANWPGTGDASAWYSTVCHVVVRVTQPSSIGDAEFVRRCNQALDVLGGLLPAWVTLDWGIVDGDGGGGFVLDDPGNLDAETFDS